MQRRAAKSFRSDFTPFGSRSSKKLPGQGISGTSMISKSQEETEVSWRLEEWALEAGVERLS